MAIKFIIAHIGITNDLQFIITSIINVDHCLQARLESWNNELSL